VDTSQMLGNLGEEAVGLLLYTVGSASLHDNIYDANVATLGAGGGLTVFGSDVVFARESVTDNQARTTTGGLYCIGSAIVQGVTASGNTPSQVACSGCTGCSAY
jgi:hypothetical protein